MLDVREHFVERMELRGILWGDILSVLLEPDRVESRGQDREGRLQVWVYGSIKQIGELRIVCSLDWDTRLITLTWE